MVRRKVAYLMKVHKALQLIIVEELPTVKPILDLVNLVILVLNMALV